MYYPHILVVLFFNKNILCNVSLPELWKDVYHIFFNKVFKQNLKKSS